MFPEEDSWLAGGHVASLEIGKRPAINWGRQRRECVRGKQGQRLLEKQRSQEGLVNEQLVVALAFVAVLSGLLASLGI